MQALFVRLKMMLRDNVLRDCICREAGRYRDREGRCKEACSGSEMRMCDRGMDGGRDGGMWERHIWRDGEMGGEILLFLQAR